MVVQVEPGEAGGFSISGSVGRLVLKCGRTVSNARLAQGASLIKVAK
jgi:hypothetical protein